MLTARSPRIVPGSASRGLVAPISLRALSQLSAGGQLLEANQLETLALETPQDLAHKSTLNTIGLDGDKGAFGSHNIG